jgi:acetyltransferase
MKLNQLFNPASVAIIGASADQGKIGNVLINNLIAGKKRKIYPINPTVKKIAGLTCYQSVLNIKDKIDLAVIAVPAKIIENILVECGKKEIKFAIIISSGFKEIGGEGIKLEEAIRTVATKYKIKLLGPNCLGLIDAHSGLNASFASTEPNKGEVAFISQSGAVCSAVLDWAKNKNIGFSKFISLGNEAGLTENDFLEHLATDKNTKAVCLYLESISDGRKFFELVKKITPHKPIVIMKAGKSGKGQLAASSHTGSLATASNIFSAACKQASAIEVSDLRNMFNLVKLFNAGIYRPKQKVAILTNAGGPSIVLVDLIEASKSLTLATLSNETKKKLQLVLPPNSPTSNPIDVIGDAKCDRYQNVLEILTADKTLDAVIVMLTPQKMTEIVKTAEAVIKYNRLKPLFPIFIGEASTWDAELLFRKNKIASFLYSADLVETLDALSSETKTKSEVTIKTTKNNQQQLPLVETLKLLKKYNLSPVGQIISKQSGLPTVFKKANQAFAMKVVSDDVIHKTDWGGVKLNIKSLNEAQNAWQEIVKNISAHTKTAKIDGMWLQPMLKGREIMIGAKRDPNFGPIIAFGLGGIFVEILNDVALRLAPINLNDAQKMMQEIEGYELLKGARGEKSVNFKALAKIIVAVSQAMTANKQIQEIDLNPVILTDNQALIVDARIII